MTGVKLKRSRWAWDLETTGLFVVAELQVRCDWGEEGSWERTWGAGPFEKQALQENWEGALRVIERQSRVIEPRGREHFKNMEFVQQCPRQQRTRNMRVKSSYEFPSHITAVWVCLAYYWPRSWEQITISFQQFVLGVVSLHSHQQSIDNYNWCTWGLFITSYFVDFIKSQKKSPSFWYKWNLVAIVFCVGFATCLWHCPVEQEFFWGQHDYPCVR